MFVVASFRLRVWLFREPPPRIQCARNNNPPSSLGKHSRPRDTVDGEPKHAISTNITKMYAVSRNKSLGECTCAGEPNFVANGKTNSCSENLPGRVTREMLLSIPYRIIADARTISKPHFARPLSVTVHKWMLASSAIGYARIEHTQDPRQRLPPTPIFSLGVVSSILCQGEWTTDEVGSFFTSHKHNRALNCPTKILVRPMSTLLPPHTCPSAPTRQSP